MRLGDLDAISNKLEEIASEPDYQHEGEDWLTGIIIAQQEVDFAPTIDAVPVVRCKDCKHWATEAIDEDGWCENPDGLDNIAKQTDFCSYGERKGDG